MRKLQLEELGRVDAEAYRQLEKIPVTIVLDNIRSGMNVGSFFRTADAFSIEKIILAGITARPPHKEILKTAIGASSTVTWEYVEDIATACQLLKEDNYHLCAIEQTDQSVSLNDVVVETSKKYALIFGNEVQGVSESVLPMIDQAIEIPQYGTKHSLNVSVCGGIVLWHFAREFL